MTMTQAPSNFEPLNDEQVTQLLDRVDQNHAFLKLASTD